MFERKITIQLSEEYPNQWWGNATSHAIGHLATWAITGESGRYAGECSIYGDREGNLHANYRDNQGNVTYQIFGQLGDDGNYSFHS